MSHVSLEQIDVASPCTASWEQMKGTDVARFCQHCQKHVHNLSAMTRSDAERLVCEKGGDLCAQFDRTADGTVVTLDYASPAGNASGKHWLSLLVLGLVGGGIGLGILNPVVTRVRGGVSFPRTRGVPYAPASASSTASATQCDPAGDFDI